MQNSSSCKAFPLSSFFNLLLAAIALLQCFSLNSAEAEPYVYTKIVDTSSKHVTMIGSSPVIENNFIVFLENNDSNIPAILWSYDLISGTFTKLADLSTPAPGGTGHFTNLNPGFGGPFLRDFNVVFGATDESSTVPRLGIFSVPVTGGAISLIANYNTNAPEGGKFSGFDANNQRAGNFSTAGGTVVFQGAYSANSKNGIYRTDSHGASLTAVADSDHPYSPPPFPLDDMHYPSISNGYVAFIVGNVFGPQRLSTVSIPGAFNQANPIVNNASVANGGSTLPVLGAQFQFGVPATAIQLSNSILAFSANGTGAAFGHTGIYTTAADGNSDVIKIVTDQDITPALLPRLSAGSNAVINTFSHENGKILFSANDTSGQSQKIFLADGSALTEVISNDQLTHANALGFPIYDLGPVQPGALNNGQVVFTASSLLGGPAASIYLATPLSKTSDLAVSIASSPSSAQVGDTLTYGVNVSCNGPLICGGTLNFNANSNISFLSASAPAASTAQGLQIQVFDTAPGVTRSFSISYKANAAGNASAVFSVRQSGVDGNSANNSASTSTLVSAVVDTVRNLLADAAFQLKTAKQKLPTVPRSPAKKRAAALAKKKLINAARGALKNDVAALKSTESASGLTVRAQLKNFTASNISSLSKALKTAISKQTSKTWAAFKKVLDLLGK